MNYVIHVCMNALYYNNQKNKVAMATIIFPHKLLFYHIQTLSRIHFVIGMATCTQKLMS